MVHSDRDEDQHWLSLRDAAQRLSVHTTTLRRWADEGRIPVMLTPGGHRRFAAADVEHIAKRRRTTRRLGPVERIWANHALELTRQKLMSHRNDSWLEQHDERARATSRELGQHLMGLIVRFLTDEDDDERLIEEARKLGSRYGDESKKIGLPLTEALRASMFFRDTLVASAIQLPDNVRVPRETQVRMMDRINSIMNMIQLGLAQAYDQPA